ncbi:MAG: glycosyltransferase family 61 protein, partial [Bacteroidota bacterium]
NEVPEMGLLELNYGIIAGPNGWIFTREGYLLPQYSWYGSHPEEMDPPAETHELRKIDGTCLSLTSDWSTVNYGHFLLDGLCRLFLFLQAGYALSDVDYFYCPTTTGSAKRLLGKLNIPVERCITPDEHIALQPRLLFAPGFPGVRRVYPRWIPSFLKEAMIEKTIRPFRWLYIPRNTTRKVQNETSLISIALDHGFEIFDPLKCDDPPSVFSEAAVVVSAHGSALADLAFCQPGTSVLELIPSDHMFPYWYTIANAAGMHYFYLVGQSTEERTAMNGPSPYDFTINEDDFRIALQRILEGQSRE